MNFVNKKKWNKIMVSQKSRKAVFNYAAEDNNNNNNNNNVSWAANQHIIMISEGSRDTENSALPPRKYILF